MLETGYKLLSAAESRSQYAVGVNAYAGVRNLVLRCLYYQRSHRSVPLASVPSLEYSDSRAFSR